MAELKIGKKIVQVVALFKRLCYGPDCLESTIFEVNSKISLPSHLQYVISENCLFFAKSQLFSEIASSR